MVSETHSQFESARSSPLERLLACDVGHPQLEPANCQLTVIMKGIRFIKEVPTEADPGRFPDMSTRDQRDATRHGIIAIAAGQSSILRGASFRRPVGQQPRACFVSFFVVTYRERRAAQRRGRTVALPHRHAAEDHRGSENSHQRALELRRILLDEAFKH